MVELSIVFCLIESAPVKMFEGRPETEYYEFKKDLNEGDHASIQEDQAVEFNETPDE